MAEPKIPADVARQANRATFWRYLSILAVVALGAIATAAWVVQREHIDATEDPCSMDLHGLTCKSRTCIRLQDVGYRLSPECVVLLNKVRAGRVSPGVGADGIRKLTPVTPITNRPGSGPTSGGGGGGGHGGNGPSPGGPTGGAPTGSTNTPPAVSVHTPTQVTPIPVPLPAPQVCLPGLLGVNDC